jgi:hypothetical protein
LVSAGNSRERRKLEKAAERFLTEKEPEADHEHWGAAPSAKSTGGRFSTPDTAHSKNKIRRFGFGGLCLLAAGIIFAYQEYQSMVRQSQSWIGGIIWLIVTIVLANVGIWMWDRTANTHWLIRSALSLVISLVFTLNGYNPIRHQHQLELKDRIPRVSTNGSPSTEPKLNPSTPTELPAGPVDQKFDQTPKEKTPAGRLQSTDKHPKKIMTPSNENNGQVEGNITQGPCSNLLIGSSNNSVTGGNCGPPERHLSPDQKANLILALKGYSSEGFEGVYCVMGDTQGYIYAQDFYLTLNEAEWNAGAMVGQTFTNPPFPPGIWIEVSRDDANSPPSAARQLAEALRDSAVLHVGFLQYPRVKNGHFRLLIGQNIPQ